MTKANLIYLLVLAVLNANIIAYNTGEFETVNKSGPGIVITFDDHYVESWYSARELFNEYGARVTFFIDNYHQLSTDELNMLRVLNRDGHEIASHGLNHLNALEFIDSNSLEAYLAEEINPSINIMGKDYLKPTASAYPFGARTEKIDEALFNIFKIIRGTTYTSNRIRLKDLNSVYYKPGKSNRLVFGVGIDGIYRNTIEEILEGIDRAKNNGEILVIYAHIIGEEEDEHNYIVSKNKLEMILQYVKENNMTFYTISEVAN